MKGNPEVIDVLNRLLAVHHASFVQFTTHTAMCEKWGYKELHEYFEKLAKGDLEAIEDLMERILFLDGFTALQIVGDVSVAETVEDMLLFASKSKLTNIAEYTDAIDVCLILKDYGSKHMIEKMLVKEDKELADIEAKMIQFTERGDL